MEIRLGVVVSMCVVAASMTSVAPVTAQNDQHERRDRLAAEAAAAVKKSQEATPIPRRADGKPNLNGIWVPRGASPLNVLEDHPGSFGLTAGPSMIVDPADGKIPYQPWAVAERDRRRRRENHWEDNRLRCFLAGKPRHMFWAFYSYLSDDHYLRMSNESGMTSVARIGGRHVLPDNVRLWMGESVAHWESDTLVIETRNLNGKAWLDLSGDFITDAAEVTERITMINRDTLWWEATITDPKAFTRPWTIRFPAPHTRLDRSSLSANGWWSFNPSEEEETCHEGNVSAVHFYKLRDQYYGRAGAQ